MKKVNILKNLCWFAVGPLLRLLISIPLAGFTAYHLGLVGYGEFALALSFVALFGVLTNVGLNEVLVRSIAQRPQESQELWSSVVALKGLLLLLYVAVTGTAAWLWGYSSTLCILVLILSVMQGVLSLDNAARSVFVGHQQGKALGLMEMVKIVTETILTVGLLYLGYKVVALAGTRLFTTTLAWCLSLIVLFREFRIRLQMPRLQPALALLPAGVQFASVAVVQSVYDRVGILLLAHFAGTQAVALVSVATLLVDKIFWFVPSVQSTLVPIFSKLHTAPHQRTRSVFTRALRYQGVIAVGCGLGASLVGPWVIRLVFPGKFWPAAAIIEIFGWVCAPRLLRSFFTVVLQSLGRERQMSWISATQCVFALAALVSLVRTWEVMGFAWAYLLSEVLAVSLQTSVLVRLGLFRQEHLLPLLGTLGIGLVLFWATTVLPGGRENVIGVSLVLSCYPLLMLASRIISREDIRYVQGLWTKEEPSTA